jgi:hypothetical protein
VYIDISTIRHAGGEEVTKGVCIGVVDEYSSHGTLLFVTAKGQLPTTLCELFAQWKGTGRPVKYVRCDNAGENKALETMSKKGVWQLALVFEYTASRTPEMNWLVEKRFDTIFNRTRSMFNYSHMPDSQKKVSCWRSGNPMPALR